MITLIPDATIQWKSPNCCIENGPNKTTIIPPPTIIKSHIANKKP